MSNSFAFGGNNASIIFSKDRGSVKVPEKKEDVYLTGIGVVSPIGNSVDSYVENYETEKAPESVSLQSAVGHADHEAYGLKMAFYRKLDKFSQLQAVSGMNAIQDAALTINDDNAPDIGIAVGTAAGPLATICHFQKDLIEGGNIAGSAFKFPNTVYNAAGGYLSICSGIKGSSSKGLAGKFWPPNSLRQGKNKIMLATGTDENCDTMTELYGKLGKVAAEVDGAYSGMTGYVLGDGSTTLVLEKKAALNRPLTYNIQTFGCQMNSHDSEKLKGIMDEIGYEEVDDEAADFVIFNTCTIRENANQKLYGHLGHVKTLKNKNKDMIVCLCGCMMQEPHVIETLKQKYKFVNIIFGTHNIYKLAELIYSYLETGKQTIEVLDETKQTVEQLPRKRKYTFKSGVNIMYGCNNFCTYCIVPYVRGREQSRKKEEILAEVEALAKQGISEVMLLGQNVNSYGNIYEYKDGKIVEVDEKDRVTFPQLLTEVCKIDGIERVRFMTSHPKDLSDELIEVMAEEPKICKHLHLPVQSGSTNILTRMNRRYTKEQYLALVDRIRAKMPNISLPGRRRFSFVLIEIGRAHV